MVFRQWKQFATTNLIKNILESIVFHYETISTKPFYFQLQLKPSFPPQVTRLTITLEKLLPVTLYSYGHAVFVFSIPHYCYQQVV